MEGERENNDIRTDVLRVLPKSPINQLRNSVDRRVVEEHVDSKQKCVWTISENVEKRTAEPVERPPVNQVAREQKQIGSEKQKCQCTPTIAL